jgi:hypothetical protein
MALFGGAEGRCVSRRHKLDGLRAERVLIHAAVLAANAHNTQPWRFQLGKDTITTLQIQSGISATGTHFGARCTSALGALWRTLTLAARAQGLRTDIDLKPGRLELRRVPDGPAVIVTLHSDMAAQSETFNTIPRHHTNRGEFQTDRPVPEATVEAMSAAARNMPAKLVLLVGARKGGLASLILGATKAVIGDLDMSRDSARWFRFRQLARSTGIATGGRSTRMCQ